MINLNFYFYYYRYFQETWFKSIDYDPNLYLLENNKIRYSNILEAHETKSLVIVK